MNTVPIDFCQRVQATRKCCEGVNFYGRCSCYKKLSFLPKFAAARNWNQSQTMKIHLSFHIGHANGKWKYGFRNCNEPIESPTMEELKTFPQLKNLRISSIYVSKSRDLQKHDVLDLKKLLKFVSFIANEPALHLSELSPNDGGSPEWETVFKWLSQRWFSYVFVETLSASNYPILEKQFSRWTPAMIRVDDFGECRGMLERRLMSGDLRRFRTTDCYKFSSTVFKQIILNFLEVPQTYAKDHLDIEAYFLSTKSTEEVVEVAVQMTLCSFEEFPRRDVRCRYRFAKQAPVLLVDRLSNGSWKLCTCEKGGWWDVLSPDC